MLKELIDNYYSENQREDKIPTKFYISDAGKCPRQLFFKFKQAPKEKLDPRIMRIFEAGEILHNYIYSIFYQLKIGAVFEVNIPEQELVSGRTDAILCIDGENYVLDIKTINTMQFKYLKAPKPENIWQLQLYMHFFDIKKGVLLYLDKDRQELKEFTISYDEKVADTLLDAFKATKSRIESDLVPQALPDYPKSWQCKYCAYREICDIAGPIEHKWLEFKEKMEEEEIKEEAKDKVKDKKDKKEQKDLGV
ncbi:MAG: Dna2/Cas4 domain-containing protein [Parcubacteria group bacterium]|nr:Dna2/Cas4 domain-containing protein [Parcubacteria group bacterium]